MSLRLGVVNEDVWPPPGNQAGELRRGLRAAEKTPVWPVCRGLQVCLTPGPTLLEPKRRRASPPPPAPIV